MSRYYFRSEICSSAGHNIKTDFIAAVYGGGFRSAISGFIFLSGFSLCIRRFCPHDPVQGGAVLPVHNGDIKMMNDRIHIYLKQKGYSVKVEYTFRNFGNKQKVVVGFPNQTSNFTTRSIRDFTVDSK